MYPYFDPEFGYDPILGAWAVWAFSWFVAALWSGRTQARPMFGSQMLYRVITIAGAVMLFNIRGWERDPLWRLSDLGEQAMLGLAVFGFLFCWWARLYLGRLWSGSVTRKEGHHIVDTGPYRLVRHPIYTGITIAALATAIDRGTVVSFVGFALMVLGFLIKARLEETFLRSELGAEAYDAYAKRTGMLLPFL
jgi:protein-S-isoprenylcysteine O-methyltransferase Ste14